MHFALKEIRINRSLPSGEHGTNEKTNDSQNESSLHSKNHIEAVGVHHGWLGPAPIGTKDHRKLQIEGMTEDEIPERFS